MYRAPLSSRRHNGNLPLGSGSATGFILPQAPYMGSLQQQHLQRNGVSLYSPRSKGSLVTALHGQTPASSISPRRTHRSPSKDYAGGNMHSNISQPAAHAASAAGRPAMPQLRLPQQQSQLFSPRQYIKPAPLEGMSARAAPQHSTEHGSHAQQSAASLTWRAPAATSQTTGSQHHLLQQQSSQASLPSRSGLGLCS